MHMLKRIQLVLAGIFMALGAIHYRLISDTDLALFWVMGAICVCWSAMALRKQRPDTAE